ncbi:DUF1801 domain-containing protein [Cohnella soli]|uniref:DUF1801 domain-containing protein n=1 Tax=Cohnella soli TaxID=425005 RepID=A0ABW0HY09_9BACL
MVENKKISKRLSGSEQVKAFLQELEHPMKQEVEEVRNIIIQSNSQLTEHIKWNAPSFCINNKDRITFNFQGKNRFRLVFHCGAKKTQFENEESLFIDESGLLEWVTGDRAILTISSQQELKDINKNRLTNIINKWIEVTKDI